MAYSEDIMKLYSSVFEKQKKKFEVDIGPIKEGIRKMGDAYLPNPSWKLETESKTTDFNNAGHRCAYLIKYAMLHTGLVCDVLEQAFQIYSVNQNIKSKQSLHLCSLGSGPGSDIVAVIFVLREKFGLKPCSASLIDCYPQWKYVFESVVSELRTKEFEGVNQMVSRDYFSYEYLGADLLKFDDYKVFKAIRKADVITMIKFISAAACKGTRNMIEEIFNLVKPGAMILFVDNAAGKFYETVAQTAKECGLESVFGPLKHYEYEDSNFNVKKYGCTTQYKTKVTVEIWVKTGRMPENTTNQLQSEFFNRERMSFYAESGLESGVVTDRVDYGNTDIVDQCATVGYLNDNDHSQPQSFRLQSGNVVESEKDSGCCTIM